MIHFVTRWRVARRKRALWAAALCSASFATGHLLFGDEPTGDTAAPSLLRQYLDAKFDLVAQPPVKRQETVAKPTEPETTPRTTETRKPEPVVHSSPKPPIPVASKPAITILAGPPKENPPKPAVSAASERPLEKLDASSRAEATAKAESVASPSLRPAAVSAAADLPFVSLPAVQPPAPSAPAMASAVKPALAQSPADVKPVVAQASSVVPSGVVPSGVVPSGVVPSAVVASTAVSNTAVANTAVANTGKPKDTLPVVLQPAAPAIQAAAPPPQAQSASEENLPPILPAGAVPRPGAKKAASAQQPPPTQRAAAAPAPATVAYPTTTAPAPLRIELGSNAATSPASTAPPTSPPPGAPPAASAPLPAATNKRAEVNSLQRLPSVVALTPRPAANQPAVGAKATSREPLLLPPVDVAQPIPVEIRNPHVAQASYQTSIIVPGKMTARSSQHLDDAEEPR